MSRIGERVLYKQLVKSACFQPFFSVYLSVTVTLSDGDKAAVFKLIYTGLVLDSEQQATSKDHNKIDVQSIRITKYYT